MLITNSEINAALIKDNGQWGENCEMGLMRISGRFIGSYAIGSLGYGVAGYLGTGVLSVPFSIGGEIVGSYIGGICGEQIGEWIYDIYKVYCLTSKMNCYGMFCK